MHAGRVLCALGLRLRKCRMYVVMSRVCVSFSFTFRMCICLLLRKFPCLFVVFSKICYFHAPNERKAMGKRKRILVKLHVQSMFSHISTFLTQNSSEMYFG